MEKKITFIRDTGLSPFEVKMAEALKKHGYKIYSVSFHEMRQEHKKAFDENIHFIRKEHRNYSRLKKLCYLPKFIFSLKKIRNSTLIGITSSSNWFVAFVFWFMGKKAICRIYFPYDIAFFRFKNYKKYTFYDRFSEKYNFRHCDGIIHKGPEDHFKYLPKEFMAFDKPNLQFLPYCEKDLFVEISDEYIQNKLSSKDGSIHLAYVGIIPHNVPRCYSYLDTVFKEIIKQEMYVHAYATNYEKIFDELEYKELQKSKYFILYKPIYGKKLQEELSRYDWGLTPSFYKPEEIKEEWIKISTGSKMSTYLEAGLPILLNDEPVFYGKIIEENGFGIVVKPWTGKKIKEMIENNDYKKMIDDIKINRNKFTIDRNIDRLISFIKNPADK